MASLILFNKPFGVLSQFTTEENRPTLKEYIKIPHVYPAGRLDHDSEGLLLLTDDGQVQHHIAHPAHKLPKTYWVQVEGAPNSYALTKLRQGVELNDGITQPAEARLIPAPKLWERDPPIRSRQNIPTQWIEIVITEGKNRQVRRMTAAVGHPTLRLVRVKIGNWTLEGIEPGKYKVEAINLPANAPGTRPNRPGTRPENSRSNTRSNSRTGNPEQKTTGQKTTEQKTAGQKNDQKPRPKTSAPKKPVVAKQPEKKTTVIIQKPKPRSL